MTRRPTRRRMRRGRVLSSLIFLNVHSEFIFRAREQVDDDGVKIDGKRVQLTCEWFAFANDTIDKPSKDIELNISRGLTVVRCK